MSEIHGVPTAMSAQLWEKINYLVADPLPDGKLKKKLQVKKDLYRLRVGEYRVFYTFGDSWVRLLGIRKRDDQTYGSKLGTLQAEAPEHLGADDDDLDALLGEKRKVLTFRLKHDPTSTPLPKAISVEWLEELKISPAYFPTLATCTSEEALLGAQIPSEILGRIVDNLFPRPLDEIIEQPDLVIQDSADLVRYKNGDLLSFLLKLDEDQIKLTDWALKGPTMVKGGAGTGKSTVALYRIKKLMERPGAVGTEKILFTTYSRALTTASRQLLDQLLSPEQSQRVRVATCDEIAREIVAACRKIGSLEHAGASIDALKAVRHTFKPPGPSGFDRRLRAQVLEKLADRYLMEEFEWIIEGRGLTTLDEYQAAPRPGRGYSLREGVRESIWALHQAFVAEVARRGFERFSMIRLEALEIVRKGSWKGHYDFVLVDEAQDLAPSALCLMAEIAKSEEGIFFAADDKQSLYSRNYSWKIAHPRLQFKGRTALLRRNYRSTIEIDRAAFEVLNMPMDDEDCFRSQSLNSGPMPVLLKGITDDSEGEWVARFIRQMAQHLRMKLSSAAVLVPSKNIGLQIAGQIASAGVAAQFFAGRELDLKADVVKVITIHSAKGLEFPIVVLAGFTTGTYKQAELSDIPDLYREWLANERKLLYVGMTRAMRGLMVITTESCQHEVLMALSSENWVVEDVT
jgi:superfamily I DNA/RNA helicase/mRNA-degrading endonuclease RelE of RelBE toxin-antitoxin system